MPISDKKALIQKVESALKDELSAAKLESILAIISTQLNDFEVTQIANAEEYSQSSELLEAFLTAKTVEGRSPKTVERYRYIISKLLDYVKTPVPRISVYHIRQYLMSCKTGGMADSTIEGIRCTFCSFFGWLAREQLIERNPMTNIAVIKAQKKVRLPFSPVELAKIYENCTNDRDLAICHFLDATGGRISEVCALNRDDIDFRTLEITVLGKGNKERKVYMDTVTAMILQRYLDGRSDDSPALFVGKGTTRLMPQGVRAILKRIGSAAGVSNVHPHRFRRTLATSLIDNGMTIQEVAHILGHERLDTTMKYVHVSDNNVSTNYQRYARA